MHLLVVRNPRYNHADTAPDFLQRSLLPALFSSPYKSISQGLGADTTSPSTYFQSRLPRGLRGSLRSSAQTLDPTRLLSRTFKGRGNQGLFSKKHPETTQEQEQQLQGEDPEEFELVNREDLPIHLDDEPLACPNPEPSTGETCNKPSSDPSTPPKPPTHSRTKSALYRLKNLSKASLHLSAFNSGRQTVQSNRAAEVSDIYLAFPRPPTHIPTPIASAYATSSFTSSTLVTANQELDDTCSTLRVSPPFTNEFILRGPPLVDSPSDLDGNPELSSTPTQTSGPFTSATALDFDVRSSRKDSGSLKRFGSLSRLLHGPFNSHTSDVSSGDTIRSRKRASSKATSLSLSVQSAFTEPLHSSTSNLVIEPAAENSSNLSEAALVVLARKAAITGESSSPAPLPIPPPASNALHPEQVAKPFPVIDHACVDPSEFTASPSPFATSSLLSPSSRTSFIPPSPSWLSRNVQNRDLFDYRTIFPSSRISLLTDSEHLKVPEISTYFTSALFAPDSPRPLPVPIPFLPVPSPQPLYAPASPYKPGLQRVVTDIYLGTPEVDQDSLATPRSIAESSSSDSGTSSIISSSAFVSAQPSPSAALYHRLSTISRISAERHRQSIAARKTRLSSPGSRRLSSKENRQSLNPLFKELSPSSSSRKQFSPSSNTLNLSVPTSLSPLPSENSFNLHAIFTPSSQAQGSAPLDSIPLPKDLTTLLETLRLETSPPPNRRIMDYTAKNAEHVDFGGEVDYSGHQWFQEPPPRPEPPPVVEPYIPEQSVIMQNEAFGFALGAAPNVLYGRYKQYGQLGVLAWCSEFGELIDSLKELGFRGNMFVTTRTQALRTCEEILKLKLDIEMQIILMYLSSQVARLRRFLDGERQWDDYPVPKFPLDYRQYGPS